MKFDLFEKSPHFFAVKWIFGAVYLAAYIEWEFEFEFEFVHNFSLVLSSANKNKNYNNQCNSLHILQHQHKKKLSKLSKKRYACINLLCSSKKNSNPILY